MKKFLFLFVLFFAMGNLSADIAVKTFRLLDSDLDARVNYPLKDQNGDPCAIIKVVTTQKGFIFDGGMTGITKTVDKPAEIWVYVPWGLKRLTISHPQLGMLRDYILPIPIAKATVYELVLTSGKVITTVEEDINSQWLIINPEPKDAAVYLNDEFVKSGVYQAKLKAGTYTYRVESPMYHTEAGKFDLTAKKELKVVLKPAYGKISISSVPESGAKVIIDGKALDTFTPCVSENLPSGEHTVQVLKDMYQPYFKKVIVTDNQTLTLKVSLLPNFAELSVNTSEDARIFINNQEKNFGKWTGRLSAGVYSIEVKKDKHNSLRQEIELVVGDKRTIDLIPTPLYGSLDVLTNPPGATIKINGESFGTTPNTIKNLLIGEHDVVLEMTGFEVLQKRVSISQGKVTELFEEMIVDKGVVADEQIVSINEDEINYLETSLLKDSKNFENWGRLIVLYFSDENLVGLEKTIERAIKNLPYVPFFNYIKSVVKLSLGDYNEALAASQLAVNNVSYEMNDSLKSVYFYQHATNNLVLGKKAEGFIAYESGLKYNPDNIQILNDYAFNLALEKREFQKAKRMSMKSIISDPNNSNFLDTYAWILYQEGSYELALEYMKNAIVNMPEDEQRGQLYDHYGDILWFNNLLTDARKMWKKASDLGYKTESLRKKVNTGYWTN